MLGERGNFWIRHELRLNFTNPFQVLVEGVVGSNYDSDIGLDDTVFSPECTPYSSIDLPYSDIPLTTTAPQPCPIANQSRCGSSDICIDKDRV